MGKKRKKETPKGMVSHTVATKSERTFERHARNKEGEIVRLTTTEKVTVQLQEFKGSIYRNGAKIA